MLKIKVFDCEDEKDLEKEINQFVEEISKQDKEVKDIKFSTSTTMYEEEQIYCFSALLMYDDKIYQEYKPMKFELIEKIDK